MCRERAEFPDPDVAANLYVHMHEDEIVARQLAQIRARYPGKYVAIVPTVTASEAASFWVSGLAMEEEAS